MSDRVEMSIERAEREHARVVTEPPRGYHVDDEGALWKRVRGEYHLATARQDSPHEGREIIKYIEEGLEWRLKQPYTNSSNLKIGGFSWCGAFAAWCDIGLKAEIRHKILPSTYRLWEAYRATSRSVPLDEIQRGDVVVVGKRGGKRWGAHITRALEVHDEYVLCIEGNAHGVLGDGRWGEGVVTRRRAFAAHAEPKEHRIMFAYRFAEEDYGV